MILCVELSCRPSVCSNVVSAISVACFDRFLNFSSNLLSQHELISKQVFRTHVYQLPITYKFVYRTLFLYFVLKPLLGIEFKLILFHENAFSNPPLDTNTQLCLLCYVYYGFSLHNIRNLCCKNLIARSTVYRSSKLDTVYTSTKKLCIKYGLVSLHCLTALSWTLY